MNLFKRFAAAWKLAKDSQRNGNQFEGGDVGRLYIDWIRQNLSADEAIKNDFVQLRARARDLQRNNAYIQSYLSLLTNNVIGPRGIKLQALVRNNDTNLNKQINDKIEAGWLKWAKNVSPTAQSLQDFEELALQTAAIDGEVFILEHLTSDGRYNDFNYALQLVDPDQVDHTYNALAKPGQNEIRMGVEINEEHAPVAYYFLRRHPSESMGTIQVERYRVPAERVIHLYRPIRAGQTRGVTWLQASMTGLRMVHGYEEAELVAARTAAAKMGWIELDPTTMDPDQSEGEAIPMEANPGQIGMLPAGGKFTAWDPQHPVAAFPAFIKQMLRKIASGLKVFYNALANDLEGVNYSSMRSGLQIERDTWRMVQGWWIRSFRERVYPRWISQALLSSALTLDTRDTRKFLDVKWTPRGYQWVDPAADVDTAVTEIANGLNSRTAILAEKGVDFEDVLEQLQEEKRLLEQYDIALVGDSVTGKTQPGRPTEDAAAKDSAETDAADDEDEEDDDVGKNSLAIVAGIGDIVSTLRAQKPEVHFHTEELTPTFRVEAPVVNIEPPKVEVRVEAPTVNVSPQVAATLKVPARKRTITKQDERGIPTEVIEEDAEPTDR